MDPTWPILGRGRSAVVFDLGDGRVLRRHLSPGYDAAPEAVAMRLAARFDVPVPTVYAVSGAELTLDRLDGPTLLEAILAEPDRAAEGGVILAELHDHLDRVEVPDAAPGTGLVHGDLHPSNVIMTADGPMLIDWTNQRYGPRGVDLATTWIILACFGPADASAVLDGLRGTLLEAFLARVDRDAAARALPAAAEIRYADRGTTPAEHDRIAQLCRAEAARLSITG